MLLTLGSLSFLSSLHPLLQGQRVVPPSGSAGNANAKEGTAAHVDERAAVPSLMLANADGCGDRPGGRRKVGPGRGQVPMPVST